MTTSFAAVANAFRHYQLTDSQTLYESLGWGAGSVATDTRSAHVVRMHLALLDAGVVLPGQVGITSGRHAGRSVETRPDQLAGRILRSGRFGQPMVFEGPAFLREHGYAQLAGKVGIAAFRHRPGHLQGQVLPVDARSDWNCLRQCYSNPGHIRFWPLV